MTDGELMTLVIATLTAGIDANYAPLKPVTIKQAYQPRTTGAPSGTSILLTIGTQRRFGSIRHHNEWIEPVGPTPGYNKRTETQVWEASFQCNAQVLPPPQPKPLQAFSAGDLASAASWILQGIDGRALLRAGGCGIYRITDIRSPYFKNEQNQFQASPSFDFVLNYEETRTFTSPILSGMVAGIHGI